MGKIVYAAAMSHVLAPDYYGKNVGPHGRKMVEDLIDGPPISRPTRRCEKSGSRSSPREMRGAA